MGPSNQRAVDGIRRDLRNLARARKLSLGAYLLLLAALMLSLHALPAGVNPESGAWGWALAAFVAGSAVSAGLALGVPLVHGWAFSGALAGGVTLMVGGLAVASAVQHDGTAAPHAGPACLASGTLFSGLAMLVLGAVSGRLWRRFPDPGFALALATTFAGVMVLHMRCGDFSPGHLFGFHLTPLAFMYVLARGLTRLRMRLAE
ncbi:MAG TPA: hypothetical protein RMG48_13390 [Myxococcales bacterium LLY-WYZ-16_1]|nr:hypothetical protein [Myxococcales bacterium LLY-WYZ-16_1]